MGSYVDIDGHATWVEERGSGAETVLLLHGGLSDSSLLLDTLGEALAGTWRVVAFDRRGHGRTADTADPFHYDDMAAETIAVLEQVVGGPAHLVGWSDGGIVGLTTAITAPQWVRSLVVIGTTFHHEGGLVPPSEWGLQPDGPEMAWLRGLYADASPDGADHWPVVFAKIMRLWAEEPTFTNEDVARIKPPVLVMVGDDDMVRFDHTVALYEALPRGQLAVVPAASHGLPLERPAEVTRLILEFLSGGEPRTMMPARRASRESDQGVSR